jgi:ABC-type nickel/cobalt efflux system permease component RcnA
MFIAAVTLGVAIGSSFAGGTQAASAHPLGTFTVNRLARLLLSNGEAQLRYVIDTAEIPAFQELRRVDKDSDGAVSEAEGRAYIQALAPEIARQLQFESGGERVSLSLIGGAVSTPEGQGGLKTLRVVLDFSGSLPSGWQSGAGASLRDDNFKDRIGWREIVVQGGEGVALTQSTAAALDETAELTAYPESRLKSPPDVREASFFLRAGDGIAGPSTATQPQAKTRAPGKTLDGFAGLVSEGKLTPAFVVFSMLAAAAWGAAHALGPGHGKTIVAAYLVGSRGTAKHAAILGLTVTATHTITVFALGLITLSASSLLNVEDLYLWLSVGSGVMVVAMGAGLFVSRLRRALSSAGVQLDDHGHMHAHDHPDHDDGHGHTHSHHSHDEHTHGGHGHSHVPAQPGLKGLIALGVSGGLLPCPTALVVMLGAIALERTAYGLALVTAFSVGLAGVLTGIGLLLVFAGRVLERTSDRLRFVSPALTRRALQALPVLSSLGIVAAGLLITGNALSAV